MNVNTKRRLTVPRDGVQSAGGASDYHPCTTRPKCRKFALQVPVSLDLHACHYSCRMLVFHVGSCWKLVFLLLIEVNVE